MKRTNCVQMHCQRPAICADEKGIFDEKVCAGDESALLGPAIGFWSFLAHTTSGQSVTWTPSLKYTGKAKFRLQNSKRLKGQYDFISVMIGITIDTETSESESVVQVVDASPLSRMWTCNHIFKSAMSHYIDVSWFCWSQTLLSLWLPLRTSKWPVVGSCCKPVLCTVSTIIVPCGPIMRRLYQRSCNRFILTVWCSMRVCRWDLRQDLIARHDENKDKIDSIMIMKCRGHSWVMKSIIWY